MTAVLPRGQDRMAEPVFAGLYSMNGNGELTGSYSVAESGLLSGPTGAYRNYRGGGRSQRGSRLGLSSPILLWLGISNCLSLVKPGTVFSTTSMAFM
ncbi:MAG: P1 family peptidase [Burkholderiales bacterium]|nr:P1 family peptidase [Burkholderiales bacterium]